MSLTSTNFDRNARMEDRRTHLRQPVRSLAYVELGDGNGGIALNISEGGMAVQAVMSLGGDDLPGLRVQLSHSKKQIELKGRVAWTADLRKLAGVQFVDVSDETRKQLREWISLESPDREVSVSPESRAAEAREEKAAASAEMARPAKVFEVPLELEESAAEEAQIPAAAAPAVMESPKPATVAFPTRPRNPVVPASDVPPAFDPIAASPVTELREPSKLSGPPESSEILETVSADEASTSVAEAASVPTRIEPAKSRAPRVPSLPSRLPSLPTRPAALPKKSSSFFAAAPSVEPVVTRDPVFLPEDRFGFKRPEAEAAAKESKRVSPEKWKVSTWVAIFVVVALAAGWIAGHGSFEHGLGRDGSQQSAVGDANATVTEEDVSQPAAPATPPPAQIEVIDLNNRRWTIPIATAGSHASAVAVAKNPNGAEDASSSPAQGTLSASNRSQNANDNGRPTPAVVNASSSEPRNVPAASPTSDGRSATPASPQQDVVQNDLLPGELIHKVEPEYPAAALDQKVEGTVKIMAVIDTNGSVKSAQPLSGPRLLIPPALDAVRQWKYGPTTLHGQAIETQRQITIVFEVAEAE